MPPKGRIFLSYRRDDSRYATRGIYDRLVAHFGEDAVFMDVDTIQAGLDFVEVLQREVQSCDVLVAVVGKAWLNIKDPAGNRRLDNPEDFVRVEITTALNRNIRVIPVLLDGVLMPRSTELPDALKPFARRNAIQVKHDSFGSDVYRLVKQLELALQEAEDSKIQKAEELKRERERALRQNKIAKLHTQADTAITAQEWGLAKKKLQDILALEADDLTAQAKLEVVEEKLAAIREEQAADQKEREAARQRETEKAQAEAAQARAARLAREKALAEEKVRQAALRKERRWDRFVAFTNFLKGKGMLVGVGIVVFLCLVIVGLNLLLGPTIGNVFSDISTQIVETEKSPSAEISSTPIPELAIGSTMISEKDDMTMVYVPAGEFQMGSDADDALAECQKFRSDCQRDWFTDEEPIHTVYLDAYWIDQTEVTNAMYAKFLNEMDNQEEAGVLWLDTESADVRIDQSGYIWYVDSGYEDHPVIEVSWYGAQAYCAWAERRLPTEAEWEKAAGWDADAQSQRLYPWGDDFSAGEANFCDSNCSFDWKNENYDDGYADTSPAGHYESGKSFYGAYDMAGNLWEWVSDWYASDYYANSPESNPLGPESGEYRVLRGGSWSNYENFLRSAVRYGDNPTYTNFNRGFRCSRSP